MNREAGLRPPIRVLVVDDHRAFADALTVALSMQPSIDVCEPVASPAAALEVAGRVELDVVITDMRMPGGDGVELAQALLRLQPGLRIVMLCGEADLLTVARAAEVGVAKFLLKDEPFVQVVAAVREPTRGPLMLDAAIVQKVAGEYQAGMLDPADPPVHLTTREREVLMLLARGRAAKTIARELDISVNTTRDYVKSLRSKLGVHSQLEAVVVASRLGLVAS